MTFDAIETIERNSYSIDKLTYLVSKMNMKMDKQETQYKPQGYQGRNRGQNRDKTIISLEVDHSVEIEINHREAEEITIGIVDQIVEVD